MIIEIIIKSTNMIITGIIIIMVNINILCINCISNKMRI